MRFSTQLYTKSSLSALLMYSKSTIRNANANMSWMRTLLPLSFALSAYATNHARADGNIAWGSCETEIEADATLPVQCGNITVPLDYTDTESDATLDVQMLKVPTDKTPKKGNIIFNFGGPGLETRASLAQRAELLQTYGKVLGSLV